VNRKLPIERLDVPKEHYNFAVRRMDSFVKFAANLAQFGTVDLTNLAASAYLQGVWDGAFVASTRKLQLGDDAPETRNLP
jgi:hypothetical protein